MMKSTAPSSILSSLGTLSLIFGGFSMQHGLAHAQCLDSEALLKVSYNDPSWENRDRDGVHISLLVNPSNITDLVEMSYPSNATFIFENCVPRDDTCGRIQMAGPPKDLYEISFDGRVLTDTEMGPEIPHRYSGNDEETFYTTTQFGEGCKPECDSDEALFEFEFRYIYGWRINWRYLVEDQNGTEIINGSHDYGDHEPQAYLGLHVKRMCLPKNGCYRLVVREKNQSDPRYVLLVASFDNKPIFERRPLYFDSIDFGSGCPSCDPDNESKVQLFIESDLSLDDAKTMSWEVKNHDAISGSQIIHSGRQSADNRITLHYDEICVPKQSCMTFSLMEEQNENKRRNFSGSYMVKMDGITYRHTDYDPSNIHLGDCAEMMSSVCNPASQTLLELNFQTKPKSGSSRYEKDFDSYWWVMYFKEVEDYQGNTVLGPGDIIFDSTDLSTYDYEDDSAYRALRCIPNIKCLYSLVVSDISHEDDLESGSVFGSYSIKVNGILSTAETVVDPDLYGKGIYVTALDNNCNSTSSGGVIAGIVVASVVVFAGVGWLVLKRWRRKHDEN